MNDEPQVEVLHDAILSPVGKLHSESQKEIGLVGCVYNAEGRKVALSERASGYYGDHYRNCSPDNIEVNGVRYVQLDGHGIYLGHFMGHYGHFITETVSSFWYLLDDNRFDYFIFHPTDTIDLEVDFVRLVFEAFGIDSAKVVFANTPYRVAKLTIPERLIKLNISANIHVKNVYLRIVESAGEANQGGRRVYLSRRMNSHSKLGRAILNERFIEDYMRRCGIEIAYPELLPFREQLKLFQNANLIIGFSGSALHNCVFMNSNTSVLEFGDIRSRTFPHRMQLLCSGISRCHYDFVQWQGLILSKRHSLGLSDLSCLRRAADVIGESHIAGQGASYYKASFIRSWLSSFFDMSLLVVMALLRVAKSDFRGL